MKCLPSRSYQAHTMSSRRTDGSFTQRGEGRAAMIRSPEMASFNHVWRSLSRRIPFRGPTERGQRRTSLLVDRSSRHGPPRSQRRQTRRCWPTAPLQRVIRSSGARDSSDRPFLTGTYVATSYAATHILQPVETEPTPQLVMPQETVSFRCIVSLTSPIVCWAVLTRASLQRGNAVLPRRIRLIIQINGPTHVIILRAQ